MTSSTIRVVAQLSRPSEQVRLVASLHADLRDPCFSQLAATLLPTNPTVSLEVTNLAPNRRYYYALEVDGVIDVRHIGRFRTLPNGAASFKFACSSCAQTGSNHTVFQAIRQKDPHFFLHMGDLHYEDIATNNQPLFQAAYKKVWEAPNQTALYRDVPIVYTWDDHDYGGNSSDMTARSRTAARLAYQTCVPHYPLAAGTGDVPIYQAFTAGRVRLLLTDCRSERHPVSNEDSNQKTLLGWPQKEWLKKELLAAKEANMFAIWINTVPWIDGGREDGWGQYSTERHELADFIHNNRIDRLLMVSGDAHMLAIDDGTNNRFTSAPVEKGFPIFHAASLDSPPSRKGGPYSHGQIMGRGQYGLVEIIDNGGTAVQVRLTGFNEVNIPQTEYVYEVNMPPRFNLFLPALRRSS